ncbi:MAG: hypothetical protein C4541_09160 [Candidatus Auribacter fodinae]|jgi:hypothetical protein|uniref:DUF507 family protein n=1 Tax=Candidatus Auribacter fodinae TaxID=2093366 RepID=A0A3A4R6I2_9BACT|nr:MAG: hypothetical protein C4541_09160 [Candidatus Auribacter fodinae]
MQKILEKILGRIVLPLVGVLVEEAVKLILESLSDEKLSHKDRVYYVVEGLTSKITDLQKQL